MQEQKDLRFRVARPLKQVRHVVTATLENDYYTARMTYMGNLRKSRDEGTVTMARTLVECKPRNDARLPVPVIGGPGKPCVDITCFPHVIPEDILPDFLAGMQVAHSSMKLLEEAIMGLLLQGTEPT